MVSKRVLPGSLLAAFVAFLAGCAPAAAPSPTASPPQPSTAVPKDAPQQSAKPGAPTAVAQATAAPQQKRPLKKVTVVTVGSPSDAGLLIGTKRGYFEEEGFSVEFDREAGGAKTVPMLATGQIDVAGVSLSAGFYNAVNEGIAVKVVADKGQTREGWRSLDWVVRKDLFDEGKVRSIKDIKGKTVAVNQPDTGAITDLVFSDLLKATGLQKGDVNLVGISYPDQVQALRNKAIDVALMNEPAMTNAIKLGVGVVIPDSPEKNKVRQVAVVMYSPQFAASEDGRRFAVAYLRGVREFNDAFAKNKNKNEVIKVLTEMTTVKDPQLYEQMNQSYLDPNGEINWASLQDGLDLGLATGLVKQKLDLSRVRDDSILQYAVQRLGKY